MVVCKYFRQGNCRYGPRCSYEHPRDIQPKSNNSGNSAFGPNTNSLTSSASPQAVAPKIYDITSEVIKSDLTTDRPQWPFSSYCPVKYGIANLIKEQDLSMEEVRLSAYQALVSNGFPQYEAEVTARAGALNTQIQAILNNLSGAVNSARKENDASKMSQGFSQSSAGDLNPVSNRSPSTVYPAAGQQQPFVRNPTTSAFGQPSPPVSVFGAPQNSVSSVFGQSQQSSGSPFGNAMPSPQAAFGQSTPSGTTDSAFGQMTNPAASIFGQASLPSSTGMAQAAPSTTSAFGQTSSPSVFGQSVSTTPATSVFGQSSQSPAASFGVSSVFGQSSSPSSAFSSTPQNPVQAFGHNTSPVTAFGSTSSPASSFGTNSKPASAVTPPSQGGSPFGGAINSNSAFGQSNQPASAFAVNTATTSAFGQPSSNTVNGDSGASFGQPPQNSSAFGVATPQNIASIQASKPAGDVFNAGRTSGSSSAFAQSNGQHQSAFGQTVSQTTRPSPVAFNTQVPSAFGSNTSASVFGSKSPTSIPAGGVSAPTNGNGNAGPSRPDSMSQEIDLPADILAQFASPNFIIGSIPEIAPPASLC